MEFLKTAEVSKQSLISVSQLMQYSSSLGYNFTF